MRFPTPFSRAGNQVADVVLGQSDFFTDIADAGSRNMAAPYGLAFAGTNGLLVSDRRPESRPVLPLHQRNLHRQDNGKAATKVFGQLDFTSSQPGASDTQMNSPHHLSADTDGRPYVVDTGNNRVMIFDQINNTPTAGARSAFTIGGSTPRSELT